MKKQLIAAWNSEHCIRHWFVLRFLILGSFIPVVLVLVFAYSTFTFLVCLTIASLDYLLPSSSKLPREKNFLDILEKTCDALKVGSR